MDRESEVGLDSLGVILRELVALQSIKQVCTAVLRHLDKLVPCSRASVEVFDFDSEQVHSYTAELGKESQLPYRTVTPLSALGGDLEVLKSQRTGIVESISQLPHLSKRLRLSKRERLGSFACVPLRCQGSLVGSLTVTGSQHEAFSSQHVKLLCQLALTLARLLRSVLLAERLSRQNRRLRSTVKGLRSSYKELSRSQHLCKLLMENAAHGIAIWDNQGRCLDVNSRACVLHGCSREEFLNRTLQDIIGPEDPCRMALQPRGTKKGPTQTIRRSACRKDGETICLEVEITRVDHTTIQTILIDVTECTRSDEALLGREERQRVLAEKVLAGIARVLRRAYKGFAARLKKSVIQLIGDHVLGYASSGVAPDRGEASQRVAGAKKPVRLFEARGLRVNCDSMLFPYADFQGEVAPVPAGARDIGRRHELQDELRLSEEQYRALVESISDPIFTFDCQGKILQANQACANALKQSRGLLPGTQLSELLPEEMHVQLLEQIRQVFYTKNSVSREYVLKTNDGNRHFWANLCPRFHEEGVVSSAVGVAYDITRLKDTEEQLRRNEQVTKALFNAAREPAFLIDTNGTIVLANEETCKALGITAEQLHRTNMLGFFPDCLVRQREGLGREAIDLEKAVSFQNEFNGRHYDSIAYPIVDRHGVLVEIAVFTRDITPQKKEEIAEREKERVLGEQRMHAVSPHRLRYLGEIAVSIAHELFQPLTGIRGVAQHLLLAMERGWRIEEAKWLEYLDVILEQVDRMVRLIENMREFSREARKADFLPTDVNKAVKFVDDTIGQQLKDHRLDLVLDLGAELPAVLANPSSLEEVLLSAVTNARDSVEERMKDDPQGDNRIRVRTFLDSRQHQKRVVIEVIDHGEEKAEEAPPHSAGLFPPTRGSDPDTTTGPSISESIVDQHGADMRIQSKPGSGTRVTVSLPPLPCPTL